MMNPRLVDEDDDALCWTAAVVGLSRCVSRGKAKRDSRKFHEMAPLAILSIHVVAEDSCWVELNAMVSTLSSSQAVPGALYESSMHGNAQSLSRLQRHGMWNSDCSGVTEGGCISDDGVASNSDWVLNLLCKVIVGS
jgi:hypothetical protein